MNWINSESWTETAVGPLALWNWCLPLNWLGRSSRAPWVLPLTILIQHLFASHHLHQHLEFKSFKTLWPRWHLSLTGSKQFLLSGFKTKLDGPSSCLTLTTLEQLSSRRYLTLWRCFSFHFKSKYLTLSPNIWLWEGASHFTLSHNIREKRWFGWSWTAWAFTFTFTFTFTLSHNIRERWFGWSWTAWATLLTELLTRFPTSSIKDSLLMVKRRWRENWTWFVQTVENSLAQLKL